MIAPPSPAAPADSDAVLVQRSQAGDAQAFAQLVRKYQRRIQRLIGRMVRDPDLAQDIAQDTFIRAYRALHQFRGDAQFYTWLYRIAVNTARKSLVQRRRDPTAAPGTTASGEDQDRSSRSLEPSNLETPDAVLATQELAAMVHAAMAALPQELQQAITLREIDGLSYEDIAARMGCPIGTVRSRIFRAREAISDKIRPLLERQGGKRW